MTNKEWLDYLAQNAPDELAAWFDAEHVERQERALDGDTEPENEDSRERLEADVRNFVEKSGWLYPMAGTRIVLEWLDRQAAITEREYGERMASEAMCSNVCAVVCEQRGRIAELQVKVDTLTAERDELKGQVFTLKVECDDLTSTCDDLENELYNAKAERERYRSKFGKCLDYADAIHALMDDEGMA